MQQSFWMRGFDSVSFDPMKNQNALVYCEPSVLSLAVKRRHSHQKIRKFIVMPERPRQL